MKSISVKAKWGIALLLLKVIGAHSVASAQQYYDGQTGHKAKDAVVLNRINKGQVLIVSELHDNKSHHKNQRDLLIQIVRARVPVSVGMEFFDYTEQDYVDQYGQNLIDEDVFLKLVNWGSLPFEFYRFQVRLPYYSDGRTYGLNFPRRLSGKVAQGGLEALSPDEQKLLPPNFQLGADTYFERFSETMKGHVSEEKIKNYFAAQSLWDDTMAWRAGEVMAANPDQILMILVGDFHVAYQDGLVARLRARGVQNILSISQVSTTGMTPDEKAETLNPHTRYGARADFIFDSAVYKK